MSSWIPNLFNSSNDNDKPTSTSSSSDVISGIKNDLAEIQGSLKSGLSLISSKIASNFIYREEKEEEDYDYDDEDVVGIDEQVVGFVRKISGRPQLWTDFPISLPNDYNLSDCQREHAACIDDLVPELVIMRQKFCSHMSDGQFWLVYFILLFPRLSDEDMELLSTPEIANARETLMKKLQKKTDETSNERGESTSQTKEVRVDAENSNKEGDFVCQPEPGRHSVEVAVASRRSETSEFSFTDLDYEDSDVPGHESDRSQDWVHPNERYGAEGSKQKGGKSGLREKGSEGEDSSEWLSVDGTEFDNLAGI